MAKIKVKLNVIYSIRKNKQTGNRAYKQTSQRNTQYLQIKHNEVDMSEAQWDR